MAVVCFTVITIACWVLSCYCQVGELQGPYPVHFVDLSTRMIDQWYPRLGPVIFQPAFVAETMYVPQEWSALLGEGLPRERTDIPGGLYPQRISELT